VTTLDPSARVASSTREPYRDAWNTLQEAIARYRIAIAVEGSMVALWFVLRMTVSVESTAFLAWAAVACIVALVSPTSGLVILMATIPFYESAELSQVLGLRHVILAALGFSVAVRVVAGGSRSMIWTAPVRMAVAVGIVTTLGVVNTARLFPADWAWHATQYWLASIGGAMIVFLVGVWVANTGARRHLVVIVVSSTIAVALALIELLAPGSVSTGPFAWTGYWAKDFHGRLSGPIASPNGMAALAVMPVCVMTAIAVLGRGPALRLLAAAGAAVLFVAMYLTYSRAALLSLFGVAVVVAWRLHRLLGVAVLSVGIVAGILLLPTYLQLRAAGGSAGASEPGSLLVATDYQRINGWGAAVAMFRDEPLIGQGFLAYKQLADQYGDPILSSPHNEWLRLFAEEGVVAGFTGLAFLATTLSWLAHGRGALAAGVFAGALGYFTMATFNNPLIYTQISTVVFPLIAYSLVHTARQRDQDTADEEKPAPRASGETL
jgi:O-antigen ligase/polysaccharide polymerase Wzy-like membrane protein